MELGHTESHRHLEIDMAGENWSQEFSFSAGFKELWSTDENGGCLGHKMLYYPRLEEKLGWVD